MLAVERRACIKETIQEQKSVAVSDLARRFDVTEETIRRDLKVLEAQGVLTRTYGGAFIQGGAINEVDVIPVAQLLQGNAGGCPPPVPQVGLLIPIIFRIFE